MKKLFIVFVLLLITPQALSYTSLDLNSANFLAQKGIIENQSLKPAYYQLDSNITRREMLKVMLNLSGLEAENKCIGNFKDLNSSDWGCKYAELSLKKGFIATNTYFRPNDNITKIESLKLIMKAKNISKSNAFDWRMGYVEGAVSAGILDKSFSDFNTLAKRSWIFNIGNNTFSDNRILQDFGYGLVLKQVNNERILYFDNEKVKTLSQNHALDYNSNDLNENFLALIIVNKVYSVGNIVLDINNNKVYEIGSGYIQKIEGGKNGIFFLKAAPGGGSSVSIITNSGEEKIIYEGEVIVYFENIHTYIYDFELINDNEIKIFYKEGEEKIRKEIIVDLDDI